MSLFGNASSSGFGSTQPQQPSNPFASSTSNQNKPSLFGSPNTNTNTSQPQQSTGIFGNLGANTQQPQQSTSLFGSAQQAQPQQQGGGLFGTLGQSTQQQPQQGGGLFGGLGQSTQQQQQQQQQQPQQQKSNLFAGFGSNTTTQPQSQPQQQGGGFFGGLGQSTQQQQLGQQQQQQQQQPQGGSFLGQSQQRQSAIWQEGTGQRHKTVQDQIKLVAEKWDPQSATSLFHTYLFNCVDPDTAAFYRPGPEDDETKWEEALRKKPSPGAIPILVKGFEQLGHRLVSQQQHLEILQGRLHEINDGLTILLRKHDLEFTTRAAECRRRHSRLSQKCLMLATKVQVLRNRGYAMDSAEEELRKKLLLLERSVFDPALNGRGEEIWARMVSVRERGRQLQQEFERAGRDLSKEQGQSLDEEVMKRAKKILEDYNSQLSHLTKELEQIQTDFSEWEQSNVRVNGANNGR
ncbi:MAG: hypothetical protein LQ347_004876 [Umbilicaria vellea]|nr:MAG: hypothetical protein LQ347_004876 [Umbilicaria vellea]